MYLILTGKWKYFYNWYAQNNYIIMQMSLFYYSKSAEHIVDDCTYSI